MSRPYKNLESDAKSRHLLGKKTALDTALHFLKFRPRSIFEVEKKLREKKYPQSEINKVINFLKAKGFLNDLEFARSWIRNRNLLKPEGKKLLFLELRKLGIEKEIAEQALQEEDMPDIEKARIIFEKKRRAFQNLTKEEFKEKMIGYLFRRGFSWETIREIMKI